MSMNPRTLRPSSTFTPRSISGLALWLDASSSDLYTTDAGPVVAVASPLDIGSLAVWLDASDSATLFQDASATTAASAASDPIGCWKDKSGNDRHYTGSSTTRPLLAVAKHNGRNSIYFDGTDDLLGVGGGSTTNSNSTLADATGACAWVVYEPNSDIDYAVLKFANSASGYERFTNGATYHTFFRTSRFAALSPAPPTSGLTLLASSASVATDSQALRINGSTIVSQPCATTFAAWRALTSQAWTVGQDASYLNGWVSEVIVLGRSATAAEVAQVEKYLAAKWGISGVHAPATASSDPVGYWGDKSGNGRHAVQATAGSRPTISATAQNGRKNLSFVQKHLLGSFSPELASTDYTVAAVVQTNTSANNNQRVFATAASTGNDFGSGRVIPILNNAQVAGGLSAYANANVSPVTGFATYGIFTGVLGGGTVRNSINRGRGQSVAATQTTATAKYGVGTDGHHSGTALFTGSIAELLYYSRALSDSEVSRIETYLAARWGITLAPQVSNADAQDWINRVYSNGGSVSSATAGAVNSLCDSVDAASLRDRFYRLNLFCGTGLNAALVPLYRGPSLGGTQYGGTTDTNVGGLFVSGDYNETGASGGLMGNGTSKYLATGLNPYDAGLVETNFHTSGYFRDTQNTSGAFIGCVNATAQRGVVFHPAYLTFGMYVRFGGLSNSGIENGTLSGRNGHLLGVRRPGGAGFKDGANINATSVTTGSFAWTASADSPPLYVFARNDATASPSLSYYAGRSQAYSIGVGMTDAQAAAYYTAMQSFQTALTRNA